MKVAKAKGRLRDPLLGPYPAWCATMVGERHLAAEKVCRWSGGRLLPQVAGEAAANPGLSHGAWVAAQMVQLSGFFRGGGLVSGGAVVPILSLVPVRSG